MAKTNRREMRKLLEKYIALMKVAFDNGINMELDTRLKCAEDLPWFTGRVSEENSNFTDKAQDGVRYLYFDAYDWRGVDENWKQVKLVEKFIEEHKN